MSEKDQLLLAAAAGGDLEAAQSALGNGASKDATTDFGFTALHVAATDGHVSVVRLLIAARADIDRRDPYGISALHQAVGHPEVMEALIEAGAEVDSVTTQGVTPLMSAAAFGEMESVRLLLGRGADPKRKDDMGSSAAEIAEEKGEEEIASLLNKLAESQDS